MEVSRIFLNAWTTWCWVHILPAECNKSDLPVINIPVFVLPEAFLADWHCLPYDPVNGDQEENGEHLLHARLYGNEMKLMCSGCSILCTVQRFFDRAKIWSVKPFPRLNPPSSCLSFWSTTKSIPLRRILQNTFYGIDSSVIPRQLL